MYPRIATTATIVALSAFAVAGCSSTASTGSAATSAPPPSSSPSTSASTAAESPTPASTPPATTGAVGATTACSLIDEATAAQILGSPIQKKIPGQIGALSAEDGAATKLDGCMYRSAAGSIGYDVVKFEKLDSATMVKMAKAKAGPQLSSGMAKQFTSAVADTLAYTLTLPSGTDSIVSGAKSGWYVTVSVALKTKKPQDSQQASDAAAQALFAKL